MFVYNVFYRGGDPSIQAYRQRDDWLYDERLASIHLDNDGAVRLMVADLGRNDVEESRYPKGTVKSVKRPVGIMQSVGIRLGWKQTLSLVVVRDDDVFTVSFAFESYSESVGCERLLREIVSPP